MICRRSPGAWRPVAPALVAAGTRPTNVCQVKTRGRRIGQGVAVISASARQLSGFTGMRAALTRSSFAPHEFRSRAAERGPRRDLKNPAADL